MIEISYLKEKEILKGLPWEVQENIKGILQILDREYGENRNKYEDNGGYVLVIEKEEDFKKIKRKVYIDCNHIIPEYVDRVICSNCEDYTSCLIICNNDYVISLIIPMKLTPQNLINYMID
ncbi:hypothetical protein [Clostridium sp.]|uniref:hypothetical protein n=1 Tax=Clostridium sp. TaxID=1506 RepID=UPI001A56CB42|nr:hypothetical protein [Clostridium sp.]MBK5241681.1 hypothetical protein [Clostridium sp.]